MAEDISEFTPRSRGDSFVEDEPAYDGDPPSGIDAEELGSLDDAATIQADLGDSRTADVPVEPPEVPVEPPEGVG